jgi:hypothetical protein
MLTRIRLERLRKHLQRSLHKGSPVQILDLIEEILDLDCDSPIPNLLDTRARAHLMLTRLHVYYRQGDIASAFRTARESLALAPYDETIERLYKGMLAGMRTGEATALFLCVPDADPAGAASLSARLRTIPGTECRILADGGPEVAAAGHGPPAPGPSGANSPVHRIREALIQVFETRAAGTCVFRVGGALEIEDFPRWAAAVAEMAGGPHDYAGEPVSRARFDRVRHFADDAEPGEGAEPYGKRFHAPFANGRFYFLSARALEAFAVASLRFPGEIKGELYEDKFVGDTLYKEGIALSAVDPRDIGLAPAAG